MSDDPKAAYLEWIAKTYGYRLTTSIERDILQFFDSLERKAYHQIGKNKRSSYSV